MKALFVALLLATGSLSAQDVIFNKADAVRTSLGIEVLEHKGFKQPQDEHHLMVRMSHPRPPGSSATFKLTIRDADFQIVSCVSAPGPEGMDFMLKTPFLAHSYLEDGGAVIPLRLYFNADGSSVKPIPNDPKTPDKEEFFTRGWKLPPVNLTVDAPTKDSSNDGTKIAQRQSAEQILRSWGVLLPEGTIVYHSLSTTGTMVKSTEKCLRAIESKLREHGLTPVPIDG